MRILRIERTLHKEIMGCFGYLGRVGQIYQNGFDLLRKDGRLIHFREGRWLFSPFGVALDRPVKSFLRRFPLREGDLFYKEDGMLLRKPEDGIHILLGPSEIVDLRKTLLPSPPGPEALWSSMKTLIRNISRWGKFDGIAGTLGLLRKEMPDLFPDRSIPMGRWDRYALPRIERLIESVSWNDITIFVETWDSLLGLGPGLTPAADDFFVGFLAAHKLFSSSFGKRLDDPTLKKRLTDRAEWKTTPVASQFIAYALEGMFAETLHLVFGELMFREGLAQRPMDRDSEKSEENQIEHFLKWGHSSGTDTLTGIVFGLWTMTQVRGLGQSDRDVLMFAGRAF